MAKDNRPLFVSIFKAMMIYCVLVWIWALALIYAWPWQKGGEWLPEFPIVAVCAPETSCAIPYGKIGEARHNGVLMSLTPLTDTGEIVLDYGTLNWQLGNGVIESRYAAWNFQTTVRYRLQDDLPVLLEYQNIAGRTFLYALGGALFSLIGIYLRKLRK